jgi:hypothetical protein
MPEQNPREEVSVLEPLGFGTLDRAYLYDEPTPLDPVGGGTLDKSYAYDEATAA